MAKQNLNGWAIAALGLAASAVAVSQLARHFRRMDLDNRVVLITGGSRGLGLEMARVFAERGAKIALIARDFAELRRAQALLAPYSKEIYISSCDVSDREQVASTILGLESQLGPVDVLVNNAGIIEVGAMEVQTQSDYEDSIGTHFWGPLNVIDAVLPAMKRQHRGRIVNISSIAGLVSVPHLLPYSASKHALVGLSEGLRTELMKDNIFVTTVCPGLMRTGSPVNAMFKGHNKIEYALFDLLDALPFTSIDAAEAAKQIVQACEFGDSNLVISWQAQLVRFAHALAPGFIDDVLGLTNILLPREGGIGTRAAKGKASESILAPSFLTKLSDDAALRNNELA